MSSLDAEHYLLSMKLLRDKVPSFDEYPFNLDTIKFHPKVTFIIGENGTGKSTLLEAIATNYGFNPEGGTKNFAFSTRNTHSELHKYIRLMKSHKHAKDGFFLRAESFYNVASSIDEMDKDPWPSRQVIDSYGGKSLHQQSHGESFFSLMMHRFKGKGVYILDEPEAALSPTRQMAMISCLNQLVKANSQFIIATHSPILLSYPYAKIFQIEGDNARLSETNYKDTEHYILTKEFICNPSEYLKQLLED